MSDGSNSLQRCEEVAVPNQRSLPLATAFPGRRFNEHDHAQDTLRVP